MGKLHYARYLNPLVTRFVRHYLDRDCCIISTSFRVNILKKPKPVQKLTPPKNWAPRALWWFRWGAMFTFITGVLLLVSIRQTYGFNGYIIMGALMGTLMFLNVWLIIWPNQKIVTGLVEGDASVAGPKALLASRTNTLFSAPMALGMIASSHGNVGAAGKSVYQAVIGFEGIGTGLAIVIAIIILLEINAIVGKMGPMASVKGVIHCSIALTAVCLALLQFV